MRSDALSGAEPMLSLPAAAPLHHSLAGCPYCENFCYDHYLEWRWRRASVVCPAVPRARANFSGGMTEVAGALASRDVAGHHARQRAGVELNEVRTRAYQFVDDGARRGAACALHHLLAWLLPAALLLGAVTAISARRRGGTAGSARKSKRDDDKHSEGGSDDEGGNGRGSRRGIGSGGGGATLPLHALPLPPPHGGCAQGHVPSGARGCRRSLLRPWGRRVLMLAALLLLLLAQRAARWVRVAQPRPCLPLPPAPPDATLHGSGAPGSSGGGRGNRSATTGLPPPLFVLLWSTGAASFTLRARRCLESVFFHHPDAMVEVYANLLPLDFFAPFVAAGYGVHVRRYDTVALLAGTPAEPWAARLSEWQGGPYYYSHQTDVLRFALLYRSGGAYLDFDVLLARPLRLVTPAQAALAAPAAPAALVAPAALAAPNGRSYTVSSAGVGSRGPRPLLRDALGIESYGGLGGLRGPTLNGAVLVFERRSRFLCSSMVRRAVPAAAEQKPATCGSRRPPAYARRPSGLQRCATVAWAP